ncbi:(2,3-dihydroxybenzoyl)adenylate synthase [Actinocorallia sp. A-T 12471]|uniref:(2,3-dihydroxybenzoyl)adenylate synthase n=1 Tax=Actinocorallia sp. A-T 12471 TaxID=3089813 RepID=UPI0029CF46F7|nr:AMP-binding protein [Actinocorallia sp. A-T 12471]MDX6741684.1 AMP-binding protein [Actinocorallia sp. A-T 12471]
MNAHPAPSPDAVPFPAEFATRYLAEGAWDRRPLAVAFQATAARVPERPAVVCGETTLTYRELDELSDRRAAGLVALGLPPGSAVLLQLANSAQAVVVWYALLKAGLVPVCTLPLHRGHEIGAIAAQTGPVAHVVDADLPGFDLVSFAVEQAGGARHVIALGARVPEGVVDFATLGEGVTAEEARATVRRVQEGRRPEDIAVFQLSGGTTGVPKVIPRLHGEYWYNAAQYARVLGWQETDKIGFNGPFAHNAGIICGIHGPHSVGAALILGHPTLESLIDVLTRQKATDIVLGAFVYDAALHPAMDEATELKRVIFSGKKVAPKHFDAVTSRGVWAGQLFGMGEGLCMVTPLDAPPSVRAETVGVPISPYDEVRILEPGGDDPVPEGEPGELCARGPYTLRGYYAAPEHNKRAFTPDGFYRTGDLAARRVVDGVVCYTVEGRIKDLINRGGEKINAEEVELLLVRHPDIVEAALVAMPDPRLGERACAYVVGRAGARHDITAIRAWLESLGVAKYKWPERVVWLDEMPRASEVGKVDKKVLRRDAEGRTPELR